MTLRWVMHSGDATQWKHLPGVGKATIRKCVSEHNPSLCLFVGFPNVGKSSVINSLKQEWICNVGISMGLTR